MSKIITHIDAEEFCASISHTNVLKILEHRSEHAGDRWYYDVYYTNGYVKRTFNPNEVVWSEANEAS